MKIRANGGHGRDLTIAGAISDKLCPNAYSYDGQLEKLKAHIDLQSEMIIKLIVVLTNKLNFTTDDVSELLGYGYEVEE